MFISLRYPWKIKHPSEILKPGQPVKVKVIKVEVDKEGKPKNLSYHQSLRT